MIDLPDHGYSDHSIGYIDAGGVVQGSLGGPSDLVDRPGLRYMVTFTLGYLSSAEEARIFEAMLEQGLRDYVSYPFPLDYKPPPAGLTANVDGPAAAGAVLPIQGLPANYAFRLGQPIAVVSAGMGYLHRVSDAFAVSGTGVGNVPVFPWTRATFADGDVVEIEHPRIRGHLKWDGRRQSYFGKRGYTFSIMEAR